MPLPKLPWYRRIQFQAWINFMLFPNRDVTFKKWLFDPCFGMTRIGQEIPSRTFLPESSSWDVDTYSLDHSENSPDPKKFYSNVLWVHGAVRILGCDFAVAFYYRGNKY